MLCRKALYYRFVYLPQIHHSYGIRSDCHQNHDQYRHKQWYNSYKYLHVHDILHTYNGKGDIITHCMSPYPQLGK